MTPIQWLEIAVLGIIFGALGQGARTIVGIKKFNDYADNVDPSAVLIDGMRLLISFGIGGVAGAFAAVTLITDVSKALQLEQLFTIAAAGYAGSDFIEGFISRISSSQGKLATKPAVAAKDSSDDAVG